MAGGNHYLLDLGSRAMQPEVEKKIQPEVESFKLQASSLTMVTG